MESNPMLVAGQKFDTGRKWVDESGVAWRIFRRLYRLGALPNATTINTAHGETIDPLKHAHIVGFWANNGTTMKLIAADPVVSVDATNIIVTATANLSAFTKSEIILEWAG